jgi:hypothetical protein
MNAKEIESANKLIDSVDWKGELNEVIGRLTKIPAALLRSLDLALRGIAHEYRITLESIKPYRYSDLSRKIRIFDCRIEKVNHALILLGENVGSFKYVYLEGKV